MAKRVRRKRRSLEDRLTRAQENFDRWIARSIQAARLVASYRKLVARLERELDAKSRELVKSETRKISFDEEG